MKPFTLPNAFKLTDEQSVALFAHALSGSDEVFKFEATPEQLKLIEEDGLFWSIGEDYTKETPQQLIKENGKANETYGTEETS